MLCKVCASPNRAAIEQGLAEGESHRQLADRYGVPRDSIDHHASRKHPPAESLADIGDEPVLPSYEWIKRQANARCAVVGDLLAMDDGRDPFYSGSETDLAEATWFAEAVWVSIGPDITGKPHLRKLHYLCVTAAVARRRTLLEHGKGRGEALRMLAARSLAWAGGRGTAGRSPPRRADIQRGRRVVVRVRPDG